MRWREGKKEWKGMWEEGKEKEKNTRDGFFWWFFGFYVFLAFDFPGFFFFCFSCLVRGEKKGSLAHGILVGN